MKPADVVIAVLVAVISELAFVASRIALDEFSPELMTTLRFAIAAIPCLFSASAFAALLFRELPIPIQTAGIAAMLPARRPQALPRIA
jgi:hypothetical protein